MWLRHAIRSATIRAVSEHLEAVTFDAGNTLLYCDPTPAEIYAEALSRHGRAVTPQEVAPAFHGAWAAMQHNIPAGSDRYAEDERLYWGDLLQEVLTRLDHDAPWRQLLDDLYRAFARPDVWRLFPDSLTTLEELRRRGRRLAIVSNWDRRLPEILDRLGITARVDTVVVSAIEGIEKPAAGIFEAALERLGIAAGAALHVGDSPREDYEGARAAGLAAALIDRDNMFVGGDYHRISTLASVLDLVE